MKIFRPTGPTPRFGGQFLFTRRLQLTSEAVEQRTQRTPEQTPEKPDFFILRQDDGFDGETAEQLQDVPFSYAPNRQHDDFSQANDTNFSTVKLMLKNVAQNKPGHWIPPNWEEQHPPETIVWTGE